MWVAAVAAAPLLMLVLVATRGVNVPQWDQWALPPLFAAYDAGTLGAADFFAQHNEHRPVVPRAIDFSLAQLTGWDIRAELLLNFAVALASFALILVLLRRTLDGTAFVIASVVASVVFFSPIQWENWLWGWQLEWFLANLAALGAIWALVVLVDRRPWLGLAVAAGCALVATYSLGHGLVVWVVGLALLLLRGRPWRTWTVLSIAAFASYFWDYQNTGMTSKTAFLGQPAEFAAYVCLYVGRPLGFDTRTGALAGAVLLAAFAVSAAYVVAHRRDPDLRARTHVWLGLGLYVVGAAVITGMSRVTYGAEQAAASRYTGMGALLAIATLALLFSIATTGVFRRQLAGEAAARGVAVPPRRRVLVLVAAPVLAVALANTAVGIDRVEREHDELRAVERCVRVVRTAGDPCLSRPQSGVAEQQIRGIRYLRSKGWAGF
jgi:hypothetical protein